MKTKKERLEQIVYLVRTYQLSNQDELLKLLTDNGFNLTQATLSRDMKELKIIKYPTEDGSYIYSLPGDNISLGEKESGRFISIAFSGNLAVLKTRPGYASGVASEIDSRFIPGILGTIAGDDTILIILKEGIDKKEVTGLLSAFLK